MKKLIMAIVSFLTAYFTVIFPISNSIYGINVGYINKWQELLIVIAVLITAFGGLALGSFLFEVIKYQITKYYNLFGGSK